MDILYRGDNESLWFTDGLVFTDDKGRKARLVADCTGLFDIAFCNGLYAVYENDEHELILLQRCDDGWKKTVILKSKSGDMSLFGLRLIASEGRLSIIYGLYHNDRKLIIHQIPGDKPQVIGEACGEEFFVRRDESGCLYMIYEGDFNVWQLCVCHMGNWSRPEEILSGACIRDIMFTGYREFCYVIEKDGMLCFKNGENEFEVSGEHPSIVKYNGGFVVLSEDNGRVSYTGIGGKRYIISSDCVRNFYLRMKDSGEYGICNSCRGSIVKGRPRLFLIDGEKAPGNGVGDSVRLEMTKRSIKLESKLSELEQRVSNIEEKLTNLCNPQ